MLSSGKGFGGVAGGRAGHAAATAILGEIADQVVHRAVFGGVDQLAAQAPLGHQPGMQQLLQMKGQRGRRDAEPLGDRASRQPVGPGRHQQPEQRQPGILGKGAERRDRLVLVHELLRSIRLNENYRTDRGLSIGYFDESRNKICACGMRIRRGGASRRPSYRSFLTFASRFEICSRLPAGNPWYNSWTCFGWVIILSAIKFTS